MATKRPARSAPAAQHTSQAAPSRTATPRKRPAARKPAETRQQQLRTDRVKRVPSRQPARSANPPVPPKTGKPKKRETETPDTAEDSTSDRNIWFSLVLILVAGLLALSVISYLLYWQADQNIATWGHLLRDVQQDAQNWGGRLGAILGDYIVGRWFGIFGELLPLVFLFLALKLLHIKALRLPRAISSTLLVMIIGSISLGHFLGTDPRIFGSGWGGTHGIYIAEWLETMIGSEGTTLLMILLALGTLYYAFQQPVRKFYNSVLQYSQRRKEQARLKRELRMLEHQNRVAELRASLAEKQSTLPVTVEPQAEKAQQQTNAIPPAPKTAEPQPETSPITPGSAKEEFPQPEAIPIPLSEADPRLISYADGTWGYLMGYDDEGQEVIYSFDRAAWFESRPWQNPIPSGEVTTDTARPEEEVTFTVNTRPEEDSQPVIPEPELISAGQSLPRSKEHTPAAAEPAITITPDETDPGFIVEQPEEEQLADAIVNSEGLYDPTLELSAYRKPPVELMEDHTQNVVVTDEELVENKNRILTTLENFGIRIDTIEATIGPTVTLYEIVPAPGVRISKIKNLEDDIALSLSALGIRIIAPIPGKGTIGIEVPNKNKEVVSMYSVIKSPHFYNSGFDLPVALGKTIQNETFVFDLAKMPHLLVAGATGQGKSVGLNAIITSLLYKKHPAELKFVLVDPKKVELTLYSKLEKHFLAKLPDAEEAIITDTQKVIYTLNSLCIEMDARYDLLKTAKVRNIKEYNEKFINRRLNPEKGHRYLPYFVVVVDEFADLIMTAGREIETPIARIAQLARAVGIHLIIATQRPTTNIITGVIKANFPARIAFRVTSMIDSRTILDSPGANQLIGRGDLLISTGSEVTRVQCAFIDTPEVERITDHIGNQRGYLSAYELPEYTPEGEEGSGLSGDVLTKRDSLFEEVARYVVSNQMGSASTIQRKFSIGFNRAGRIVDQLEAAGVLGRSEGGGKPRQVLVTDIVSLEMILDSLS